MGTLTSCATKDTTVVFAKSSSSVGEDNLNGAVTIGSSSPVVEVLSCSRSTSRERDTITQDESRNVGARRAIESLKYRIHFMYCILIFVLAVCVILEAPWNFHGEAGIRNLSSGAGMPCTALNAKTPQVIQWQVGLIEDAA